MNLMKHRINGMMSLIEEKMRADATLTSHDVRKALEEFWDDEIAICWTVDDILETYDAERHDLTRDEAREVLRLCDSEHDCNVGINWDIIDHWIRHVLMKRKAASNMV